MQRIPYTGLSQIEKGFLRRNNNSKRPSEVPHLRSKTSLRSTVVSWQNNITTAVSDPMGRAKHFTALPPYANIAWAETIGSRLRSDSKQGLSPCPAWRTASATPVVVRQESER